MKVKDLKGEEINVPIGKTADIKESSVLSMTLSLYDMQSLSELSPTAIKERIKVLTKKFKKLV